MSKKHIQRIELNTIENPKFLKSLSYKEISLLCFDIREEIIKQVSINGGHLSSNLGTVEALVALHRTFDFSKDKLLLDVGHQCYTHKILTGRSLEKLRKKDGVSGFPKLNESIYDHFEGGHSSNSISTAEGMALTRDLNSDDYNIIVFIGDASIQNGMAFEAMNDFQLRDHKILIVLNENGMSISQSVGRSSQIFSRISTSKFYNALKIAYKKMMCWNKFGRWLYEKTYILKSSIKRSLIRGNIFTDLGLNYIGAIDGHSVKSMEKAFKRSQKSPKSCVIHIKTQKGKGYKLAEDDKQGYYHGTSSFEVEKGLTRNDSPLSSWTSYYSYLLEQTISDSEKVTLICPGTMIGSRIETIKEKHSDRVFDVGIAEEHAVSLAAGMSLNGYRPYISIYSTFLQRAFDQLSHDIARVNLNSCLLIERAGIVGEDGDTHNGVYDEAFLINTPNTIVSMASNTEEASYLMRLSTENKDKLFCIRIPKSDQVISTDNNVFDNFKWISKLNSTSNKKVIITFGPIINQVEQLINEKHKDYDLVNALFQKPLDLNFILNKLINYEKVVIYNIYGTKNGFNNYLISILIENGYKGNIVSLAVPDTFISHQTIEEALVENSISINDLDKVL